MSTSKMERRTTGKLQKGPGGKALRLQSLRANMAVGPVPVPLGARGAGGFSGGGRTSQDEQNHRTE